MGLSTGTLVKSSKKTETTTSMPNKKELNELQEEIRILKRNISLMLEENFKLNQTNLELRNKLITISTNLSHQNNSKVQNDVINIPGDSDRGRYLIYLYIGICMAVFYNKYDIRRFTQRLIKMRLYLY